MGGRNTGIKMEKGGREGGREGRGGRTRADLLGYIHGLDAAVGRVEHAHCQLEEQEGHVHAPRLLDEVEARQIGECGHRVHDDGHQGQQVLANQEAEDVGPCHGAHHKGAKNNPQIWTDILPARLQCGGPHEDKGVHGALEAGLAQAQVNDGGVGADVAPRLGQSHLRAQVDIAVILRPPQGSQNADQGEGEEAEHKGA